MDEIPKNASGKILRRVLKDAEWKDNQGHGCDAAIVFLCL